MDRNRPSKKGYVMARIAIIGSTGYIGSAVERAAKARGHEPLQISRANCNIYDPRELAAKIQYLKPDWLINCAGYTGKPNVDTCEFHKAECLNANSALPGIVGDACKETDTPWGHIGSGCIFTGDNGGKGFTEEDPPNFGFRTNNCSFYSGTKALSEEVLADYDCYVWRVRIPFNHEHSERNYISKLLRYETLLQATNSFSHLDEFSHAAIESFELQIPMGLYNVTNPGAMTTKDVTAIIKEEGLCDKKFEFFKDVKEFLSKAAITPRSNCVLNVDKALTAGLKLTPVKEAFRQSIKNWVWE
jgi:dTDP-4-dehydrorhamnose reductase